MLIYFQSWIPAARAASLIVFLLRFPKCGALCSNTVVSIICRLLMLGWPELQRGLKNSFRRGQRNFKRSIKEYYSVKRCFDYISGTKVRIRVKIGSGYWRSDKDRERCLIMASLSVFCWYYLFRLLLLCIRGKKNGETPYL